MEAPTAVYVPRHRGTTYVRSFKTLRRGIYRFTPVGIVVVTVVIFFLEAFAGGLVGNLFREIGRATHVKQFKDLANSMDNAHRDIKKTIKPYGAAEEFVSKSVNQFSEGAAGEVAGPALAQWIRASKNDALSAGVNVIPTEVRAQLSVFFNSNLLEAIRYRVGRGNEMSLAANSFRFGDRSAITLDNVIVFRDSSGTKNLGLWAHEIGHVLQYQRSGIEDFAKRYVRGFRDMEGEADDTSRRFVNAYNSEDDDRDTRFSSARNTAANFYIGGCNISGHRVLVDRFERVYPYGTIRPPQNPRCAFDIIGQQGAYCVNRGDGAVLKFAPSRGWYPVGQCYGFGG